MPVSQPDILLVGGGVIGLTTALKLAEQGVSVTLVDRQRTGQEASWAGGGMLPPGNNPGSHLLATDADRERYLRTTSNRLWAGLSEQLLDQTGIDNGFRRCGGLEVGLTERLTALLEAYHAEEIRSELIEDRAAIERHVPGLATDIHRAVWLADFCQVRNPRHLKALRAAAHLHGAEIVEDVSDLTLRIQRDRVRAESGTRTFTADCICLTAGAWTSRLLEGLGVSLPVRPIRGQMLQLRSPQLSFRCIIEHGSRYLVPRPDGLILAGSTEEDAGFEKQTTSAGIHGLLEFAASLVPELAEAEVVRQWAGLRPGSPSGLPYLGRITAFDNLFVGAGHFRSGLQMSPATAELLTPMLLGHETANADAFCPLEAPRSA